MKNRSPRLGLTFKDSPGLQRAAAIAGRKLRMELI